VEQGHVMVSADASGYPPDLRTLYAGVEDATDPKKPMIYFMRHLPRDPFYPDGQAPAEQTWGLRSYASPADSPQPGDDVYDVYSLSKDKGLNGVPYHDW
jgi:general secretion pathway protein G